MGLLDSWKPAFSNCTAYKVERRVWLNDSQELTKICGSSVNTLGSRHKTCCSVCRKCPFQHRSARSYRRAHASDPNYRHFSSRQIPQSTGNPPGQVLPIFLPLEPHNYPHGTLEEVILELQSNFPMLVGSQKHTLFSFWTAGYKRGLPVPSPGCLGPEDCSRFQESSLKGCPTVIV